MHSLEEVSDSVAGRQRTRIHGIEIESDLDLGLAAHPWQGTPPALEILRSRESAHDFGTLLWRSSITSYSLHAGTAGMPWLVSSEAAFEIGEETIRVCCTDWSEGPRGYLLGAVLALWLERRGIPVLHASSVEVGDGAVGFLAPSGGGKSTLVAALTGRGWRVVCDDVLAIRRADDRFVVHDGRREVRLRRDSAVELLRETGARQGMAYGKQLLIPADGQRFEPRTLRALWVLNRGSAARISFETLEPGDALMSLLAGSFAGEPAEALGLGHRRLAKLAELVEHVQVSRLTYPEGFERLDAVCDAVEKVLGES